MKFSVAALLSAVAFATSAFAQSANIGAPADMTTVSPGSNMTVMIQRPDTLSSSEEVAVVIGIVSCSSGSGSCPGPSNELGTILYNGPFNPQFTNPPNSLPPHENYTVTIPATLAKGTAQLGVAHFTLIGAGLYPFMETFNTTLNVV